MSPVTCNSVELLLGGKNYVYTQCHVCTVNFPSYTLTTYINVYYYILPTVIITYVHIKESKFSSISDKNTLHQLCRYAFSMYYYNIIMSFTTVVTQTSPRYFCQQQYVQICKSYIYSTKATLLVFNWSCNTTMMQLLTYTVYLNLQLAYTHAQV